MGIRGIVQLAPSAFLASAAGTSELQDAIIQNVVFDTPYRQVDACLQVWSERSQVAAPQLPAARCQRVWDQPIISKVKKCLMLQATDPLDRSRLLVAQAPHSGDWLQ